MRNFFYILIFISLSCINSNKKSINPEKVIVEAINISYDDLSNAEKEDMIFTKCCCYPYNWNRGVDCIENEKAFYVKAKIDVELLATLSESDAFKISQLITSNPRSLYGKYHNRWQFKDENGKEICETSKFDGHNDFSLKRIGYIDELIIGPLPKKPSIMLIKVSDSKYYEGIIPEVKVQ